MAEAASASPARQLYAEGYEPPDGVLSRGVMGMYVFIASEIMFFGTLFATYYYLLASRYPNWPPSPEHGFELVALWPIPILNTVFLLSSSVTFVLGENFLLSGRRRQFLAMLTITIVLGALFEVGQATEYIKHDFIHTYKSTEFSSAFYTMTGFHGAHVAGGIVLMGVLLYRALRHGHFTPLHHVGVRAVGIYWHFVDVVWLFLLSNLYFLPDCVLRSSPCLTGGG